MFEKCNEKRAFLPEQFDIFTVRSFHRHFGEYKHAKSSDKKYAKILIDHKIADEIKETSFYLKFWFLEKGKESVKKLGEKSQLWKSRPSASGSSKNC